MYFIIFFAIILNYIEYLLFIFFAGGRKPMIFQPNQSNTLTQTKTI